MQLLTRRNAKTEKGEEHGYLTAILNLLPGDLSGYEVCPRRTKDCFKHCLNTAGSGRFRTVQDARMARTKMLFEKPEHFYHKLVVEITDYELEAIDEGKKLAVRMNGTSDIRWEQPPKYTWKKSPMGRATYQHDILSQFENVQFYDYTKWPIMKRVPCKNYHLTYSYTGYNKKTCLEHLERGYNIAMPYSGVIPKTWRGYPCIDGEENDLRFLDPSPSVVMLKAKGTLRGKNNPFVKQSTGGHLS